jgi:hypothetical protein
VWKWFSQNSAQAAARAPAAVGRAGATLEVELSYQLDLHPIWTRECTGCHEKPQLSEGLELVGLTAARTYRNIVDVFAA